MRRWRARTGAALAAALGLLGSPLAGAPAGAGEAIFLVRVAGADRYESAAGAAQLAFGDGTATALLARGDAFPDALAGSYLAGSVGGPVLLTTGDQLSAAARSALDALDVSAVRVLGGTGAVSSAVIGALEGAGFTVERVAGANRYETAAEVAAAGGAPGELHGAPTAIVASGAAFPDALAAGPLSYAGGFPILLTPPDALAPETDAALRDLGIGHVLVMGGTAAVSDATVAAIEATGATTERVAGANRAATAAAAADLALDGLGWAGDGVALARGDAFPDGLAAGPLAGEVPMPILLTDPAALSPETAAWLGARGHSLEGIVAVGGTAAVSDDVLAAAAEAAIGSDVPYAVEGDRALLALSADRTCTVRTPRGAELDLQVVPTSLVTLGADGAAPIFADEPADGVADAGSTTAVITAVDGRTLSPSSGHVEGVESDGAVEVTMSSTAYDAVVLVAFTDTDGGTAHALDVEETGAAIDVAAAGCRTVFAPPEAPLGTHAAVTVGVADTAEGLFVDAAGTQTFQFDDADSFAVGDVAGSAADFRARLSQGDVLDVDYTPGDAGVSAFKLVTDTVKAVGTPNAVATEHDVEVAFAIPPWNGDGTTYRVFRVPTFADGDGCSSSVAQTGSTAGTTVTSPFADPGVADGCYIYRVISVASDGQTRQSPFSAPVKVPGPPAARDVIRPESDYAAVTSGSSPLGAGDTVTLAFSEPMAAPVAGASVTVAGRTFTAGSGATFSLNAGSVTVDGVEQPANTVLTIAITADPAGGPVPLPATISSHAGITDVAGNSWDIAASEDTTLEAP